MTSISELSFVTYLGDSCFFQCSNLPDVRIPSATSIDINQAKTRGIVATSHDGIVTLSGLDNGEEVHFYTVDGKQIGTVKAIDGVAYQVVSSASLVIAKIGGQAIKIAVK